MAKVSLVTGTTSYIAQVFIQDSSSTTGAGLTGLAYNSGSLTAYYHRDTDTTATAITLANMTVGTFTSSGFKEIDATNMPGWYQFCPPNAALASGAKSVSFLLKGATNMAPLPLEIELTAINNQDGVRFGMTALPAVASGSAGAVITAGTGTAQLSVSSGVASANATQINGVATTSVTTVNANIGTTQPVNFTGTGASALAKSDMVDIAGAAVSTSTAQIGVNAVQAGGTAWGSGAITAGSIASNALTAAKIATDAIGAAQLAADAVTEIQSGLATSSALTTVSNKLGSITGSGSNTVLGYFQSIARSDVTASTDLAGTFDSSTDSLQALKDDQMTAQDLEDAVWDATLADHQDSGSTGEALGDASSAGDPWNTSLPGAYSAGTAGYIIGNNLDQPVSEVPGDTWDVALASHVDSGSTGEALNAAGAAGDPWITALPGAYGAGTAGYILGNNLDAPVSDTATAAALATAQADLDTITGSDGAIIASGTQTFDMTGDITGSLSGSVGSVTARVTANTDQLAGQTVTAAAGVTFPTSVASPTNITAGTITTVTNLTNAPTNGDLTATMKASVTTAATAATPTAAAVTGAVGSVTGNVGGNVVGSVGSVTGAVGSVTGNVGGNVTGSVGSLGATAKSDVRTQAGNALADYGAIP